MSYAAAMKTPLSIFALSAIVLATAPLAHSQQPASSPPLVSVTGEAEIRVAPDIVVITFGVEARATGLDEAAAAHSEKISKLIGHIKEAGVEEKHIQTDYINVRPSYDHRVSRSKPSHFEVNKSVTVRVTDIKKFETLLAGALKNGATHVHGVRFLTSELRKHRDAARANAIKAAKEKAVALTSELGASIGQVYSINENTWGGGGSYNMRGGLLTQNSIQNISGASAGGEFAAGQIAISARVNVAFVIE